MASFPKEIRFFRSVVCPSGSPSVNPAPNNVFWTWWLISPHSLEGQKLKRYKYPTWFLKINRVRDNNKAQLVWVKGDGISSLANWLALAASWQVQTSHLSYLLATSWIFMQCFWPGGQGGDETFEEGICVHEGRQKTEWRHVEGWVQRENGVIEVEKQRKNRG